MPIKENRVTQIHLEALRAAPLAVQGTTAPTDHNKQPKEGKLRKRKDEVALAPSSKILTGKPRGLGLMNVSGHQSEGQVGIVVRDESPWDTFKKEYECDLAGATEVVSRKAGPRCVYSLRRFPGKTPDQLLARVLSIHHENIASALEYFFTSGTTYAIGEFFPLTLGHVVACKAFPTQVQLTAILVQVLEGMTYLLSKNLSHPSMDCSHILLNTDGKIRIGCIEECEPRVDQQTQDREMANISKIMMELLQKYVKDGAVGIDDLDRWPSNSLGVDFLSRTTTAGSIESLKQHPLLTESRFAKGELVGLAWFALHSTRTFYSYTPWDENFI